MLEKISITMNRCNRQLDNYLYLYLDLLDSKSWLMLSRHLERDESVQLEYFTILILLFPLQLGHLGVDNFVDLLFQFVHLEAAQITQVFPSWISY